MKPRLGLNQLSSYGGGEPAEAYDPITALGAKLVAWWDADAGITQAGNVVSAWTDRVAGYATTPAGSPAYNATGFNGTPCVIGDGVDAEFTATAAGLLAALPDGAEAGWMLGIIQQDTLIADAGTKTFMAYGGAAAQARRMARAVVSSTNRARATTGASNATDTHVDLSSRHVVLGKWSGTTTEISVDGFAADSAALVPATVNSRLRMLATAAGSAGEFSAVRLRDAMFGAGTLTVDEEAALMAWALPRRNL